jgi:hypothetical protein
VDPRAGLDDVEKRKFLTLMVPELRSLDRPARVHDQETEKAVKVEQRAVKPYRALERVIFVRGELIMNFLTLWIYEDWLRDNFTEIRSRWSYVSTSAYSHSWGNA